MSIGGWAKAFLVSFIFIVSTAEVKAAPWQINPFIKSLKGSVYEFNFLVEGLKSVHSFNFEKSTRAQYQEFFNRMTLGLGVDDGAQRIQVLEKMEPIDLGTLAHESFHAFKANLIEVRPEYLKLKLWMKRRARIVFGNLSQAKAETALEEAYAVFIDNAISARMNGGRMLKKLTPEKCARHLKRAEEFWEGSWRAEVSGYYYRDGIGEYWADRFSTLMATLSGRGAPNNGGDRAIFTDASISELDKEWIAKNILEGKVAPSFAQTFAGDQQLLLCAR